jgi:hypothetical protein
VATPQSGHRKLRRAGLIAAGALVAVGAMIALVAFLSGRDSSGVSSTPAAAPGQAFPDQGARHLRPGQRPPAPYNSRPPTSGAHVPTPVTRDDAQLTDDQLLTALEAGNVVLFYGTPAAPPGLKSVATEIAGVPFDPAVGRAGQAVIVARRPGTSGVVAAAWRHLLHASSAQDPALRTFTDAWLGVGAEQT